MLKIKQIFSSAYFYTFITTGLIYGSKFLLDQYIGISQSQNNYFIWNKIQSLSLLFCQIPIFAIYLSGLPKLNSFNDIKDNNALNSIFNSLLLVAILSTFIFSFSFTLNIFNINFIDHTYISAAILFISLISFQITQTTLRSYLKFLDIVIHATLIPPTLLILINFINKGPIQASYSFAFSYLICTILIILRLRFKHKEKIYLRPILYLKKSFYRGNNVYLFGLLAIIMTEGDKLIVSLSSQYDISSAYLFFRNTSALSFAFASVISSTFYPKILNKVSGDLKELKKYIKKMQTIQFKITSIFSIIVAVTASIIFYYSNNQYLENISIMYIFIFNAIPVGSLMLTLNIINALNKEIIALKLIIPIVLIQIIIQIYLLGKLPIIIYALMYSIFIMIYLYVLNKLAQNSLNLIK